MEKQEFHITKKSELIHLKGKYTAALVEYDCTAAWSHQL